MAPPWSLIWIFFKNINNDSVCLNLIIFAVWSWLARQNVIKILYVQDNLWQPYLQCAVVNRQYTQSCKRCQQQVFLFKVTLAKKILLQANITLSIPCTVFFADNKGLQRRNISKKKKVGIFVLNATPNRIDEKYLQLFSKVTQWLTKHF